MTTRVVVLGAGFGGLEFTTLVAQACADDVDIVLIDKSEGFVFGFSKLDVMFGHTSAEHVLHRFNGFSQPHVRFVNSTVRAIDPAQRTVVTDDGVFEADVLLVALGADVHPELTPGLVEGGHEFYSVRGAFGLHDVLESFEGGRVVIGVTAAPFKCPPAPSETALLVDELLRRRGLRDNSDISLLMPFGVPIPPSPEASHALLAAFSERDIEWCPERLVRELDVQSKEAVCADGSRVPYDLFLGVPVHRAPAVVEEAGLTTDGWVAVDPLTLETRFPGVYAVGDVTSVGTPKAGVFAEGQAAIAAARVIAQIQGSRPDAVYDGRGICYVEFGSGAVAKVDVTFRAGERPVGDLEGPSPALMADKARFGADRVGRWFGREWRTT